MVCSELMLRDYHSSAVTDTPTLNVLITRQIRFVYTLVFIFTIASEPNADLSEKVFSSAVRNIVLKWRFFLTLIYAFRRFFMRPQKVKWTKSVNAKMSEFNSLSECGSSGKMISERGRRWKLISRRLSRVKASFGFLAQPRVIRKVKKFSNCPKSSFSISFTSVINSAAKLFF